MKHIIYEKSENQIVKTVASFIWNYSPSIFTVELLTRQKSRMSAALIPLLV